MHSTHAAHTKFDTFLFILNEFQFVFSSLSMLSVAYERSSCYAYGHGEINDFTIPLRLFISVFEHLNVQSTRFALYVVMKIIHIQYMSSHTTISRSQISINE